MYILHEGFDTRFRDFEVGQFFNGVFVYSASKSGCDGNERFGFHPWFCRALINGSYLVCLCVRACLGNLSWQ